MEILRVSNQILAESAAPLPVSEWVFCLKISQLNGLPDVNLPNFFRQGWRKYKRHYSYKTGAADQMLAKSVKIIGFGLRVPGYVRTLVVAGLFSSLVGGFGGLAVAMGLLLFPGGSHPAWGGLNEPGYDVHLQTVPEV